MKVFDFTSGKRGKYLGESRAPTSLYPHPTGMIGGERKAVTLKSRTLMGVGTNVDLHEGACREYQGEVMELDYTPAHWGVEAITFCMGKFKVGEDITWEWVVVGTDEWVQKNIGQVLEAKTIG